MKLLGTRKVDSKGRISLAKLVKGYTVILLKQEDGSILLKLRKSKKRG